VAKRALFEVLPKGLVPILRELGRVVLRRPVVGIVAVARRADGHVLLIKRGDTGTWALPGGTLEWGERAAITLARELREEAGATLRATGRLVGIYTDPARDARMHAVSIVVEAQVDDAIEGPVNPLEIHDARFFAPDALPTPLAYTGDEMVAHALAGTPYWE